MSRLRSLFAARRLLFVALAIFVLGLSVVHPVIAENGHEVIPPDPALRVHQLENGMRVWIRPNANPPGRVYLWMRIATGSLNETESERGLAHLLEHMAFRNSTHFPDGTMFTRFEEIGLRPGAHQNAFTGHEHTTYTLTLPNARPETIEQGLLALSDVAYRLELTRQALDLERAIVLEEARLGQGPWQRIGERVRPFLLPGSRYSERAPIGTEAAIRGITLPMVQEFYRRGYRPDKTALIVVGDVAPEAVLPLVRTQFDGWKKPAAGAAGDEAGVTLYRDTRALVITEPEIVKAQVQLIRLLHERNGNTLADLRRDLVDDIVEGAIGRRLNRMTTERRTVAGSMSYSHTEVIKPVYSLDWFAEGPPEKWPALLASVIEEQKRLREHGLREEEIEEQRREVLVHFEEARKALATVQSRSLMSWLFDGLDDDTPPPEMERVYDLAGILLPTITTAEVNTAARRLTASEAHRMVVVLPKRERLAVPTPKQVLKVAKAAAQNGVTPTTAHKKMPKLLAQEPTPGMIAQRSHDRELNVTSLVFDNGVRLQLRPMSEQKNQVEIEIRLAGGEIEETADNRGISLAASLALLYPTTSRLTPSDLERLISARSIMPIGMSRRDHFLLEVYTVPDDLEEALRVAHALLTDAHVDERVFQQWQERMRSGAERRRYNLRAQVNFAAHRLFTGSDPRFAPYEPELTDRLTREAAQAWLDRLLRQTPMEVAIVGDFDLERAIAHAGKYLGSLPKRPASDPELDARRRLRAVPGPHETTVTAETETPRTDVYLAWRGADWKDTHDRRALDLAERLLTRKLMHELREQRGWVYSLSADSDAAQDYLGNGRFVIRFSTDPARAPEAMQLARQLVEEMAAKGPTEEELTIVRRQLANEIEVSQRSVGYWMSGLSGMHMRGDTLDGLRGMPAAYQRITAKEVRDVLARYIIPERRVAIIGMPQVKAAAAGVKRVAAPGGK
ncbi:MAG: M16 family metallopeptidase [Sulfuricaulis sp.]